MTRSLTVPARGTAIRLACLMMLGALTACSSIENLVSSDKVDYRSGARQTAGLDVPPDLTQLARDSRAQVQDGVVSASTLQQSPSSAKVTSQAAQPGAVALAAAGDVQLARDGSQRWLRSSLPPEQLWPQLKAFWQERGLELTVEQPDVGLMETNWAENRAKLPNDFIRNTLGKVLDGFYSTGERDKYRTRVERNATGGTDIFIAHRGLQEVYTTQQRDSTAWQPRASDPLLEAEMLSRLLLKLGGKQEQAKALTQTPVPATTVSSLSSGAIAKARPLSEVPTVLQVNEGFERAWRRVGQSLDRHGFTIEDRDRKQGLFFLRYADPSQTGKEEPGFFAKLFSGDKAVTAGRYRVSVKSEGERSTVSVLDDKGQQQTDDVAKGILNLLMDDLR